MAALPYLRKFTITMDTGYTPIQGVATASADRLYIGGQKTGAGLNGKIFVYDWEGNRHTSEEFTVDATLPLVGIFLANDTMYVSLETPSVFNWKIVPYSLGGDAGVGWTYGSGYGWRIDKFLGITYSPSSNTFFTLYDVTNTAIIAGEKYFTEVQEFRLPGRNVNAIESFALDRKTGDTNWVPIGGIASRPGGIYVAERAKDRILAYDAFIKEDRDDFIILPDDFPDGTLTSITFFFTLLAVVSDKTSDFKVFLFGEEFPPGIPGVPRVQYHGFSEVEERFDVVKPGSGVTVQSHVATDVKGLRETEQNLLVVTDPTTLQNRLRIINFIPKITIPDIEEGDVVFLHYGDPGEKPTTMPMERWEVQGQRFVGNYEKQVVVCKKV